jgi:hypothetical protein
VATKDSFVAEMIYGEKVVYSGPRILSASAAAGTLTVKYDNIGTEGEVAPDQGLIFLGTALLLYSI